MTSLNLLSSAAPWSSVESFTNAGPQKKKSSMNSPHTDKRKTQKNQKVHFVDSVDSVDNSTGQTEGFEQRNLQNQERISKVESIINQMNSLNLENDGNSLENFDPVPRPELQPLEDLQSKFPMPPKLQEKHDEPDEPKIRNSYLANDPRLFDSLKTGSSYQSSYNGVPYYAKLGGGTNRHFSSEMQSSNGSQTLLIEKLNYMIHLLEQQQFEKTDNIMEEFFLYLLLGGFMIYVVDSFTKTGKYIR